jgi:hypothetical protein
LVEIRWIHFQVKIVNIPAMAVTIVSAAAVMMAPGAGSVQNVVAHNMTVSAAHTDPSNFVVKLMKPRR